MNKDIFKDIAQEIDGVLNKRNNSLIDLKILIIK